MSDRFPLLEVPAYAPGQCICCGTPTGPYVDTGVTTDAEGALIICRADVLEMAETFGALRPEKVGQHAERLRDLEEQTAVLRARLAGLQYVADALAAWREVEAVTGDVPAGDVRDSAGDAGRGGSRGVGGGPADGDGGGTLRPDAGGPGGGVVAGAEPAAVR